MAQPYWRVSVKKTDENKRVTRKTVFSASEPSNEWLADRQPALTGKGQKRTIIVTRETRS